MEVKKVSGFTSQIIRIIAKVSFTQQVVIAILLGILVGYLKPELGPIFSPIGQTFVNLLKMIIVPTLFFSITSSIVKNSSRSSNITSIAFSSIIMYTITTFFAILAGVIAAKLVINYTSLLQYNIDHPSKTLLGNVVANTNSYPNLKPVNSTIAYTQNPFVNFIISIIPINPLKAFSDGDMMQIIFFAIFLGVSIKKTKDNDALKNFIKEMTKATYTMTGFVISLSPIGIFSIFCAILAKNDKVALSALIAVSVTLLLGVFLHVVFVYFSILKIFRYKVFFFIRNVFSIQVMAFGTSSSSSCLPYTIKTAKEKLRVSDKVASIVLPLGATMNMDGLAIFISGTTVLISHVLGFHLGFDGYLKLIFATTLLSIGTAGVPNVGLVALYTVTSLIGLKVDVFLLLIGIDRLLDMIRTSVNVTGDVVIATSLSQLKKFQD